MLRIIVGGLLLAFGLQWLRKAILRASGYKACTTRPRSSRASRPRRARPAAKNARDSTGTPSRCRSRASCSEGLEVAFIVITFGSAQGRIDLAALGAGIALVLVAIVGVLVRGPLTRVPENSLKFAVGVMLTTFGIFWSAEGAGAHWPGDNASLPGVLAFVVLLSFGAVAVLKRQRVAFA